MKIEYYDKYTPDKWEEVPDEDLYQDGELNNRSAMVLAWT